METVITAEILTLLYGRGIHDPSFKNLVLVQILPDDWSGDLRPFSEKVKLARFISKVLQINLTILEFEDRYKVLDFLDVQSLVDLSVVSTLGIRKKQRKGATIISIVTEHVALNKPSIFLGLTPPLKRRLDSIRYVFLPFSVYRFYNLKKTKTRIGIFHEKSLNLTQVIENNKLLFRELKDSGYPELFSLAEFDEVVFVFPLSLRFGGAQNFNSLLFRAAVEKAISCNVPTLIVKNHPSDGTDYSKIMTVENTSLEIIFWSEESMRMIPLELLVHCAKKYSFVGFYSTMMLTHSEFVNHETLVVLPKNKVDEGISSRYYLGKILTLFPHTKIRL